MRSVLLKLSLVSSMLVLVSAVPAAAHVVVKPAEVVVADFQTFTMGVPNEKDQPTTAMKLVIPVGLQFVSPTQKPGWHITVDKEGSGENATVKSITWSGGSVDTGLRDEFTFSAKVPDKAGELRWKAYQTYEDGTVVSWDKQSSGKDDDEGSNSGPFSVTKVVVQSEQAAATGAAADAKKTASHAQNFAVAALGLSLLAVALATRKKS